MTSADRAYAAKVTETKQAKLTRLQREAPVRKRQINRLKPGPRRRAIRARLKKLRKAIKRLKRELKKPKIIASGLNLRGAWGSIGTVYAITVHYAAGPRDSSDANALELCRSYDRYHAEKFRTASGPSDGIAYHLNFTRAGNIILLRPFNQKGAHVGGFNAGNIGVLFHGSTGDEPTAAQKAAWRWWLKKAHTRAMPESHRLRDPAWMMLIMGHREWSGHGTNSCPGRFTPTNLGSKT